MNSSKIECDKLTDKEIVKYSLKNIDYFACLYSRYEDKLINYIFRISNSTKEEAEDILHESFIKIWKNLNNYNTDLQLSSWIYRIVHNETISYWRKKTSYGKDNIIEINDDNLNHLSSSQEVEEESSGISKTAETYKVLDKLKQGYKDVLILKYFENMSYVEISDILKIPEGTVATRLNRAKKSFIKISGKENLFF